MYNVYGHRQNFWYENHHELFDFLCSTATRNMLKAIGQYVSPEGSVRFYRDIFAGKWYSNERIDDFFHDISRYIDPSAVRPEIMGAACSMHAETEVPLTADTLIGMELVYRELTHMNNLLVSPDPTWFDPFGNYLFYLLGIRIDRQVPRTLEFDDESVNTFFKIEEILGYDEDNQALAKRVTIPSEMQFQDSWFNTLNNNGEEFFGVSFAEGLKKLRKEKPFDADEDAFVSLGLERELFYE